MKVDAPVIFRDDMTARPTRAGYCAVWVGPGADPERFTPAVVAAERAAMPGWRWQKEYRGEFDAQTGQSVFPAEALDWQRAQCRNPVATYGYSLVKRDGRLVAEFTPHENGPLRVWMMPDSQPDILPRGKASVKRAFAIGADVAEGVGKSDSAAVVLCRDSREQAAEFADPWCEPANFGRVLAGLGRWFNTAIVCPVRPMHGITVIRTMLDEQGYSNLWRTRTLTQTTPTTASDFGWSKGEISSAPLFDPWVDDVIHQRVTVRSLALVEQMHRYFYDETGRVTWAAVAHLPPEQRWKHGDIVVAAALANRALADAPLYAKVESEPPPPSKSFARRRQDFESAKKARETW